ncbi:MAG: hypothetical protein WBQ21_12005 [Solirubrobacteraceae bacterium]
MPAACAAGTGDSAVVAVSWNDSAGSYRCKPIGHVVVCVREREGAMKATVSRHRAAKPDKRGARKKAVAVTVATWRAARVMRRLRLARRRRRGSATSKRSRAVQAGSVALGSFALGASAFGAMAIGALAIRRLAIKRGVIGRLEVEQLKVGRLEVDELVVRNRS